MKKIVVFMAILLNLAFGETKFIADIKTDLIDPNTKSVVGEILEGTPVEIIKDDGKFALVEINCEVSVTDDKILALKKDPLVVFFKMKEQKATPKAQFLVDSTKLGSDPLEAWEEVEMLYYDTCSSCHAAHKPKEHLMIEWDALISAMQLFAKIDDDEKARLLRYVQAYAKDGIVKE